MNVNHHVALSRTYTHTHTHTYTHIHTHTYTHPHTHTHIHRQHAITVDLSEIVVKTVYKCSILEVVKAFTTKIQGRQPVSTFPVVVALIPPFFKVF